MAEEFESEIKISGRMIRHLGSQSISSDSSAIFELVKNAKDANARSVEITFENVKSDRGRIIVKDDGHGMSKDDVLSRWLVAGTDYKINNPRTESGRRMLGEMGIGRFSCEKLSNKTIMVSRPKGKNEKVTMVFDWKRYESANTIDGVKHKGRVEDKEKPEQHGLELYLEDLKSKWSNDKFKKFEGELESYILPSELREFEIKITAEEFSTGKLQIKSAVTKIAPLKMRAAYDGREMSIKIYDAENKSKGWIERDPVVEPERECGPFKLKLFFFPLDRTGESRWSTYYGKHLTYRKINSFLKDYSGIYLYRDSAWMKPYGGTDDWLGLEGRRVQRRDKIGRAQVYGIVNIGQDNNPEIKPTAHREVLQENKALEDLQSVLMSAIKELERYRGETKTKPRPRPDVPVAMAGNNISQIIKLCRAKEDLTKSDTARILQYATSTKKFIAEHKAATDEKNEERMDLDHHKMNVISIGLMTSYAAHEVADTLASTAGVLAKARGAMEDADFSKAVPSEFAGQWSEQLSILESNTGKLGHFLSFVDEISSHMEPLRSGRRESQISVGSVWKDVSSGFQMLLDKSDIKTEFEPQTDLKIKFSVIDLESILANLMTNSIEALKGRTSGQKAIRCAASYRGGSLLLKFTDNGDGISYVEPDRVFLPFVTTRKTADGVAHGHGLGLPVVREILERHGGTIAVSTSDYFDSGATFDIRVPCKLVV